MTSASLQIQNLGPTSNLAFNSQRGGPEGRNSHRFQIGFTSSMRKLRVDDDDDDDDDEEF